MLKHYRKVSGTKDKKKKKPQNLKGSQRKKKKKLPDKNVRLLKRINGTQKTMKNHL